MYLLKTTGLVRSTEKRLPKCLNERVKIIKVRLVRCGSLLLLIERAHRRPTAYNQIYCCLLFLFSCLLAYQTAKWARLTRSSICSILLALDIEDGCRHTPCSYYRSIQKLQKIFFKIPPIHTET